MGYADQFLETEKDDFLSKFIADRGLTQPDQEESSPQVIQGEKPKRGKMSEMTTALLGSFAGGVGSGLAGELFKEE
tara:strand:- start:91 stop:318 length:228 start_codon:yes stop_codon:yes gene_type:complete